MPENAPKWTVWRFATTGDWWLSICDVVVGGPYPDSSAALLGAMEFASDMQRQVADVLVDMHKEAMKNVVE